MGKKKRGTMCIGSKGPPRKQQGTCMTKMGGIIRKETFEAVDKEVLGKGGEVKRGGPITID